jgi:hypothetical protein
MKNLLIPLILVVVNYSSSAGEIFKDKATPITSVPYTISSPGTYYLANDIFSSNPNGKIVIVANNVVLDLAGHTLHVATTDECILIEGTGKPTDFFPRPGGSLNVTVQNGTLVNTIAGCIYMAGNSDVIDHVTMLAAGQCALIDELGFFDRISNCIISSGNPSSIRGPSWSHGLSFSTVFLIASGVLFENNMVTSSYSHGDSLESASHPDGGDISNYGNVIRNNVIWGSIILDPIDISSGNLLPPA